MTAQLIVVLILTFIINLISTLSLSVRIAGIRTGRIAVSFALFNILVLISRTANGFQAPLLAKTVENDIRHGVEGHEFAFRMIILSSSFATAIGSLLIPTFQRLLSRAVVNFGTHQSMLKLIRRGFLENRIKSNLAVPSLNNLSQLHLNPNFPWRIVILNTVATAIMTIGVLSAVYAAYLTPEFRTTASNLSAFINGFATILLFIFIDPHLSAMTDDVSMGKCPEATFRRYIIYMSIARLLGTILAQFLFMPAAHFLAGLATLI